MSTAKVVVSGQSSNIIPPSPNSVNSVCGNSDISGTSDFLIGRLMDNGGPDVSFGVNGLYLINEPGEEQVNSLALSADESILYVLGNSIGMESAIMMSAHYTGYESEIPVSNESFNNRTIRLYPNPTKGILHIETGFDGNHHAEIINMAGTRILSRHFKTGNMEMDLSSLPPSIYFISVTLPDKQVLRYKIVKQ